MDYNKNLFLLPFLLTILFIFVTGGLKNLNLIDLLVDKSFSIALIITIIACIYFFKKEYFPSKNKNKTFYVLLAVISILLPLSWFSFYLLFNFLQITIEETTFFILISVSSLTIYGILIHPKIDKSKHVYINQKAKLTHHTPILEKGKFKQLIVLEFENKIRDVAVIFFDIFLETYDKIEYSMIDYFPKEESSINKKKNVGFEKTKFSDRFCFSWNYIKKDTKILIKILAEWSKDDDYFESIKIKPEKCKIELGNGELIGISILYYL